MKRVTVLAFLVFSTFGHTQNINKPAKDAKLFDLLKYDAGSFLGGMGYTYSRPLHWKKDDWLKLGGTLAGTYLIFTVDEETSTFFQRQENDIPKSIKDYGFYYGKPVNNYAFTGSIYLVGLFTKSERWRRTGILLLTSSSAAGVLQQIAKSVAGRERPGTDLDKNDFRPFNSETKYHSFPSGHSILSFTNAYALAKHFKSPWVKAGIYTVGMIPPVSRLWAGAHWLSDVALSIAISIATVEAIDKYLDMRYDAQYQKKSNKISWDLKVGPTGIGAVLNFD